MNGPRSIEGEQRIEVLGLSMTVEEYLHLETRLENLLASLNVIAEQSRAMIERLDRILNKPEKFNRTETKADPTS
jgi:chromosome segregation ATPase